jgi:hypothetical protein
MHLVLSEKNVKIMEKKKVGLYGSFKCKTVYVIGGKKTMLLHF